MISLDDGVHGDGSLVRGTLMLMLVLAADAIGDGSVLQAQDLDGEQVKMRTQMCWILCCCSRAVTERELEKQDVSCTVPVRVVNRKWISTSFERGFLGLAE